MKLASVAFLAAVSVAAVTPSAAFAWYCSARGTTGASGWGRAGYLATARAIALRECAVRTPTYARCYIMYCKR